MVHALEALGHEQGFEGLTVIEIPGEPAGSSAHEAVPVLLDKEPEALPALPAPVRGDRQLALLLLPPLFLPGRGAPQLERQCWQREGV